MKTPNIFTIPKGEIRLTKRAGNAYDVGRLMKSIIDQSAKDPTMIEFVRRHPMDAKEIFDYVYSRASFQPDKKNEQIVKTPMATIRTKRANCVNYSTLIGTLNKLNGINGNLRLVTFEGDRVPKHVYVVTEAGEIQDAIIGQKPEGEKSRATRENKTGKFNEEVKSFRKFDMPY